MPVDGPIDREAFQLGQYIMGNGDDGNVLELFLGGLMVDVQTAGGDAKIDGTIRFVYRMLGSM